jgi:hypothetical protein
MTARSIRGRKEIKESKRPASEIYYHWDEMPEVFYEYLNDDRKLIISAISIRGEKWSSEEKLK